MVGFGAFSGNANETDMMMRNVTTGTFELYNIRNNAIASANAIGNVGVEWQVAGFGPFNGAGSADMVLRNSNTGTFEVYDIANSQLTTAASLGQVGQEWQLGGFAADPPSGTAAASTAQLVQAMASFGASEILNNASAVSPGIDPSQQALLATPQ